MTPLREVVDSIQDSVAKLEDDLKVRVAEYSNVKTQLSTTLRKQSGRYFMLHPNMLEMGCNCDHIMFSLLLM
jgi:hypothetical protein